MPAKCCFILAVPPENSMKEAEDEAEQVRLYYTVHLIPGYNDWEIQGLIELKILYLRCVRLRLDQIDARLNILGAGLEPLAKFFDALHGRASTTLLNAHLVVRNVQNFDK
jgi:hypothetical protein